MNNKEKLKIAVIAGASHAMQYKEKNPNSSLSEVLVNVTKNIDAILNQIDE